MDFAVCLTPDILASLFNAFFLVHDSENPKLGSLNSRARSQYIESEYKRANDNLSSTSKVIT